MSDSIVTAKQADAQAFFMGG